MKNLQKRLLSSFFMLLFFSFCFLLVFFRIIEEKKLFLVILLCLSSMAFIEWFQASLGRPWLAWTGFLFLSVCWTSFFVLYTRSGIKGVLMPIILSVLSDSFGYVGGQLWGGKKLCPTLSPQKTWMGFWASLLGGTLVGSLMGHGLGAGYSPWIIAGGTLSSIAGDLLQSKAKRILGVKDLGTLLPGHGGLLDRMDSWLMTALYFQIVTIFMAS